MRKKPKRLVALLLSLLIAVSMIPANGLIVEADTNPKLAQKSVSIVIGETSKIKVKNAPKGAKITYKSAKKSIATVSKQGKVKGIKSGTTKITVYVKENSKTTKSIYRVTVKEPKLSRNKLSLVSGKTATLSVKNKPKKAEYTWISNNPRIAAVSKNGKITAMAEGDTAVKVKVQTANQAYNLSCQVSVKPVSESSDDVGQTYTVMFNSNGGSAVASQTVKKDALAKQPSEPTRRGYTFDGWFTAASGGTEFDFNTPITANITLYAHWSSADRSSSGGGSFGDESGSGGGSFGGGSGSSGGSSGGGSVSGGGSSSGNNEIYYVVTFNSNGGSAVTSQTVKKNDFAKQPADPTRDGYSFDGWYTAATIGDIVTHVKQKFDFNTAITGNKTLYAHWVNSQLSVNNLGISHIVQPLGRYLNWAGISTVSQFADEQGRFCFAFCDGNTVTITQVNDTKITKIIQVPKLHPLLGAAACDDQGNLYLVWGHENEGTDTTVNTIFVSKYSPNGEFIAAVGGNGSEGLAPYDNDSSYTKIPFRAGNCDVAVNGNLLLVNYAREMYSGHQSNGIFAVNTDDMTVNTNFVNYNSHSFDQRVTPFQSTGGFLIQSQCDCFPRAFTTAVTNSSSASAKVESFHFWVQKGTLDAYDMSLLNKTYARLGNILDAGGKAALVCSSARSLSEKALDESYDVFIQIFDPTGKMDDANNYTTSGTRSGFGGGNGDTAVTDYGVKWLTNFAETDKTVDVVQAVTTDSGNIVVLYELYTKITRSYDSTWYMILDTSGNVVCESRNLGDVRLNIDEDPVYINKTVQWVSNIEGSDELRLNVLTVDDTYN